MCCVPLHEVLSYFPRRVSTTIHHISWAPTKYRVPRRKIRYTTLGIEKTRPRYVVKNRGKCEKHVVPSVY